MPTEKPNDQDLLADTDWDHHHESIVSHNAANDFGLSMKGHVCPDHEDRHSPSPTKVLLATIAGGLMILAAGILVGFFVF
jgi:hypothetical protein